MIMIMMNNPAYVGCKHYIFSDVFFVLEERGG
jgi:hypothetical protein